MKSLMLVAHGSRLAASNEEVRVLAARLQRRTRSVYEHVGCAFLELARPSIGDGLRQAIDAGAREIVVLPYFLSAGRHVVSDIPDRIQQVRLEFPQVRITVVPYLGASSGVVELLAELAGAH